jgi:ketosteroid isomerase-like protein
MTRSHAVRTGEEQSRREIELLFEEWWAASSAKDIDAVMRPIADDVVSYEHNAPLQYIGVDAVRVVCQEGFDWMEGEFRWDVPDLQVIVRGDIAVTWGLNHMRSTTPDGTSVEQWSRGTRVFQRTEDGWKMVHQHVSFPYDPVTGLAVTDAVPSP